MTHPIRRGLAAAVLPLLLAGGCMSAGKRLEQGARLEEAGRPADAARRYIDALRRDPSLAEARTRLAEAAGRAADAYLTESGALSRAGNHADAAETLLTLDALRREAASVGVELDMLSGYPALRRERFDAAIAWSEEDAERLAVAGRHADALGRLERAAARWAPSAEQRRRLDEGRLTVYVDWTEYEIAAGRYRAAYGIAERGMAAFGEDERLAAARVEALEAGTVRVAVLPVHAGGDAGRALDAAFVRDLENELELAWGRPPAFVAVADPRDVRAEARRYRGGDLLHVSDAARLGRALDADLVVMVEIDSVAATRADERSERRAARTRGGADTAYTVVTGRSETWVRARYTLVDVERRERLDEETVAGRASRPFREARYAGDWRQLLLQRDELRAFDTSGRDEVSGELAAELVRTLAEELPQALYARVLRGIR